MRKIVLFIASSLDGFIARKNNGIDWLFSDSLFKNIKKETKLKLAKTKKFETGLIQLHYILEYNKL